MCGRVVQTILLGTERVWPRRRRDSSLPTRSAGAAHQTETGNRNGLLLATAGKANGRNLSLVMAGVVRHDRVNRMALAPNSYARPIRYATPANIQIPSL